MIKTRYVPSNISIITGEKMDTAMASTASTKRSQLKDSYGRRVNSLRVSITQRCNFDCFFCHQEGENDSGAEATPEEIEALVSVAAKLGVRRLKLTGGEPLLRDDVVEIVRRVSLYVEEVSMTTNGYLLAEKAYKLKEAGLRRINVSLHSGDPEVFCKIIGRDALPQVREGIVAARECGLNPVKLNMVVMKGVNDGEIEEMIAFAKDVGATLQLIEFQPLERGAEGWEDHFYDLRSLETSLEARSTRVVEREMQRRRQYHLEDGGIVEVVRPMHNSDFCRWCTRLRVTSDGCLKPCLMRGDNHVEAVTLLRNGGSREDLVAAFKEAVSRREPYWR